MSGAQIKIRRKLTEDDRWSLDDANQDDWLDVLTSLEETILARENFIDSVIIVVSGREKIL
jgi:hypothetical protein